MDTNYNLHTHPYCYWQNAAEVDASKLDGERLVESKVAVVAVDVQSDEQIVNVTRDFHFDCYSFDSAVDYYS